MHILPRTVTLYLKAEILRNLPAKVELGRTRRGQHFTEALQRIENRKASLCRAYARGGIAHDTLIVKLNRLLSLYDVLLGRAPHTLAKLNEELVSLAITHRLPALMSITSLPPGVITLAQARFGESRA